MDQVPIPFPSGTVSYTHLDVYKRQAMLRFTLVSQNEEFASHLGAFLFGNSIRQQKSAEG